MRGLTSSGGRGRGRSLRDALQAVGWQEHEIGDVDGAVADRKAAQDVCGVVGVQPAYHHLHACFQLSVDATPPNMLDAVRDIGGNPKTADHKVDFGAVTVGGRFAMWTVDNYLCTALNDI